MGTNPHITTTENILKHQGQNIPYQTRRSRKRTKTIEFGISIRARTIYVNAPHRLTDQEIQKMLKPHLPYLQNKLNELQPKPEPEQLIWYLGQKIPYTITQKHGTTQLKNNTLTIAAGKQHQNKEHLTKLLENWYKQQAHRIILPRIHQLWEKTQDPNPQPPHTRISSTYARWGSCTPHTRKIRVTWRAIMLPPELLDYVIYHELAHLHNPGHGTDYYQTLHSYLPDHQWLRTQLRKTGQQIRLPF